jgi:2-alkenal reductase
MLRRFLFYIGLTLFLVMLGYAAITLARAIQNLNSDPLAPVARPSNFEGVTLPMAATPTLVPIELIAELNTEDQVLINLYQRVNPSVVSIEAFGLANTGGNASGFVYNSEGYIITNAHVVVDAVEIRVIFSDGYLATAEVTGLDEYSDLAVIRVETSSERLIPVTLGDSSQLLVGQRVVAIGNPFGLQSSMTRGIVSAVGRALPSSRLISLSSQRFNNPSIIQVDAVINPGNSGGPLLNYAGQVIGVNSAIQTDSGIFEGVAFAVPVNTLKRVAPQLIEKGRVDYPWLGVSTFPESLGLNITALAEALELPVNHGILIWEVSANSPAEQAGLQGGDRTINLGDQEVIIGGDIIVAVNGILVKDLDQLLGYLVENTSPGDTITLTVVRGEETLDMEVELGLRPS